jgi:hypothetical protein
LAESRKTLLYSDEYPPRHIGENMKTTVAAAVSIAGVLAAGAGAFAVNTAVLSASPQTESAMVASAPVNTSVVAESQGAGSLSPVTTNSSSATASDNSTSTYKVGDAGRVILAMNNGTIQVVNVLPSDGWTAKSPEYDDGEVEVKFRSSTVELEFSARVKNGQIEVYVESEYEDADESYEREDDHHDDEDHDDEEEDD